MILGSLKVRLLLRESRTLKDKRQVVQSIKDRLRGQFNVAVAEVESLDNRQLAVLGFATVANEAAHVRSVLEQIVSALRGHPVAEFLESRDGSVIAFGRNVMKTHRVARIAEAIREVVSETILFELSDPRVKSVTVTRAEVSGDLQHAKVYVSIMGSASEQKLTLYGLDHAAGFIQARLAKRLQTRFTPTLRFVLDQGVKNSIEMTRLINEALAPSRAANGEGVEPPPEVGSADGTAEEDHADS